MYLILHFISLEYNVLVKSIDYFSHFQRSFFFFFLMTLNIFSVTLAEFLFSGY